MNKTHLDRTRRHPSWSELGSVPGAGLAQRDEGIPKNLRLPKSQGPKNKQFGPRKVCDERYRQIEDVLHGGQGFWNPQVNDEAEQHLLGGHSERQAEWVDRANVPDLLSKGTHGFLNVHGVLRLVSELRVNPDPGGRRLETRSDESLGTVEILDQVDLTGEVRA